MMITGHAITRIDPSEHYDWPDIPEWKPADTAPYDTTVLIWWIPIGDNPWAQCVSIGQRCFVQRPHADEGCGVYEEGCWWSGGRYYAGKHITHWMPLPPIPTDSNLALARIANGYDQPSNYTEDKNG